MPCKVGHYLTMRKHCVINLAVIGLNKPTFFLQNRLVILGSLSIYAWDAACKTQSRINKNYEGFDCDYTAPVDHL